MLTNILNNNNMFLKQTEKNPLDAYNKKLENFQKKFNIFENLIVGEKIGKEEQTPNDESDLEDNICIYGNYCIYEQGFFQKFYRWWNNENYDKTFKYLDNDFNIYIKYLDDIKYYKELNYIVDKKFFIDNLVENIIKFNNKIIFGLYNLKQTYIEINKLKAKIESIILTLIDFNTEISVKKSFRI